MFAPDGSVAIIYVPARHVISDTQSDDFSTSFAIVEKFYKRAPYKWLVLYNEPKVQAETETDKADKKFFSYEYEDRSSCLEQTSSNNNNNNADSPQVIEEHEKQEEQEKEKQQKDKKLTRRVVGEVVDFGVDYDNVPKLIVALRSFHKDAPKLDAYLFHGPFAEVARRNCDLQLYKLPYVNVHDAFDELTLGRQTYVSVLKHILCDTLQRYRIKTIKFPEQQQSSSASSTSASTSASESQSPESEAKTKRPSPKENGKNKEGGGIFYYGFTEDGLHFSKTNRHVYNVAIPPLSKPSGEDDEYEERASLFNNQWLNMRKAFPDERVDYTIRRGYVIYGRPVEKVAGQTTLEWCTPAPGIDLLRVYLATNGKSSIFKNKTKEEIKQKLCDKNGNETLASQLFAGIVDNHASNEAITYVRKELMWAYKHK
jgi:hypothetical protein